MYRATHIITTIDDKAVHHRYSISPLDVTELQHRIVNNRETVTVVEPFSMVATFARHISDDRCRALRRFRHNLANIQH